MPYFIESDNPECSGWATVKDDGDVMGCHQTKQEAIDQMVALSIAEDVEPGGERSVRDLPDNYRPALSDDVPEGRACGNCVHYDESDVQGDKAFCHLWDEYVRGDHYCNRWESSYMRAEDETSRQVDTDPPEYIMNAAARGLELRGEGFGGDGLTDKTIREARQIADGVISEDKVIRANAWGARHEPDLDATSNSDPDDDGFPGPGAVAHYLWGIDPLNPEPAREWFARKAEQIQNERDSEMTATMEKRDTDNLVRHLEFRVEKSADGLTLDGYGAVFDQWTDIEDAVGVYRERIAPGAFKRTLGMRMPILQFDHGSHPLIGSIPLGRITNISEDDHGLRVKARLSDNWLVQPVRDAIRDGGITGMSFRFRILDESWERSRNDGMEERTIREVELYEVGPVVFPAYEQTSVGVRSRAVLSALEDAEIRGEIATILAAGTDLASLAEIEQDDPDSLHSSEAGTPTESHVPIRTRTQRQALRVLAGL
jgi:HK97 family phage prohead protease